MSIEAGRDIWAHFSKFADYEDLKDLYRKVVPTVAVVNDNYATIRDEVAQFNQVIAGLDTALTQKANKKQIDDLRE